MTDLQAFDPVFTSLHASEPGLLDTAELTRLLDSSQIPPPLVIFPEVDIVYDESNGGRGETVLLRENGLRKAKTEFLANASPPIVAGPKLLKPFCGQLSNLPRTDDTVDTEQLLKVQNTKDGQCLGHGIDSRSIEREVPNDNVHVVQNEKKGRYAQVSKRTSITTTSAPGAPISDAVYALPPSGISDFGDMSDTNISAWGAENVTSLVSAATVQLPELDRMYEVLPERTEDVPYLDLKDEESSAGSGNQPKLRYSKGAAPSKYCHVCGRSAQTVNVAHCGNIRLGLCRKVLCDKCLILHQPESAQDAKLDESLWLCTHCRGICPTRARCHQYTRNNMRRRIKNEERRRVQEERRLVGEREAKRAKVEVAGAGGGISPTGVTENVFGV